MSKGTKITEHEYLKVKGGGKSKLSKTSMIRIEKSKNWDDFKKISLKDRGPKWRATHTIKDNRKWWEKLFNI